MSTKRIEAYVDPSVMTYAIQTIAGMAIALGTFIGLYWRKIKRFLEKKYHLDFSGDKVEEGNDLYHGSDKEKSQYIEEKAFFKKTSTSSHPISLKSGILISIALSCLWMFYAPLQLYFTNIHEFRYDLYAILPTILLMFVVGLIVGIIVFLISKKIHEKVYLFGICVALILLIASFIQGNFLLSDLPHLDGSTFQWNTFSFGSLSSIVVWTIVIVLVSYSFIKLNKNVFVFLSNAISILLICVCVITLLLNGIISNGFFTKRPVVVSKENLFTYSTNQNFIIFIIDAVDAEKVHQLIEGERQEYKEIFSDFTFYPDTVAAYPFTKYSIPFILTGIWNENQEDFISFETKAMDESVLLKTLENRSYDLGMYEADLTYDSDHVFRFSNIQRGRYHIKNIFEFARTNGRYVWFLYAPYPLKRVFADPGMISVLKNREEADGDAFFSSNADFYHALKTRDIETVDEKCFRFIHIDGAHVPFQYDEQVNTIPISEGSYELSIKCSMTIVKEYMERLKEADVYDDSAIIIMADHGYVPDEEGFLGRENPVLFVKGIQEKHDSLIISKQPISYDDLQVAYQRLLEGKESKDIFDAKEDEKRRRRFIVYAYADERKLYEYYQEGYASDESTLIPTGVEYILESEK